MKKTTTLKITSKKITLLLTLSLSISFFNAQTYTSISDGNWTDVSGTWSTDGGITDCSCNPPLFALVISYRIEISHEINMDSPINIGKNGSLYLSTYGSLISADRKLILNGTADINGFVNIKSFEARDGSLININNSLFKTLNQINIYGTMNIDASILEVQAGNIYIEAPDGELYLTGGSKVKSSGNFNNEGYTFICSTCCIESTTGNIQNTNTGTIAGDGALLSTLGNIINDNLVASTMKWCVAGNSFGMPNAENCIGTNNICAVSPLSLNQNRLYAQNDKNKRVILTWINTVANTDFTYVILKSEDNAKWTTIETKANGNSDQYKYFDSNIEEGIIYYKIKFIDNNKSESFSNTISINIFDDKIFNLYPNPLKTNDYLTLNSKERTTANIKIYNHIGQLVFTEVLDLERGGNKLMIRDLKPSFYNVVVDSENAIHNQRLLITD